MCYCTSNKTMRLSIDGTLTVLCLLMVIPSCVCNTANIMNTTKFMSEGESIVSSDGSFKFGFFNGGRFVGIWFNKISVLTVTWVANRNQPLINSPGVLTLTSQGILRLLDQKGSMIWSTKSPRPARNPVVELQNSGNLVVKEYGENNEENFLWQSFDYPYNTHLAGMKFGRSKINGFNWYLNSWKSKDDPSLGNFTLQIDLEGLPQLFMREGSVKRFRLGPWNGLHFSGKTNVRPNPVFSYEFVDNEKEIYFTFHLKNNSVLTTFVLSPTGEQERFIWINSKQIWQPYFAVQTDECDQYAFCGSYTICDINNSPFCSCIKGFEPKSTIEWDRMDWSSGCVRKTQLDCSMDGFQKYSGLKVPDARNIWSNSTISLDECRNLCKNNCSCSAYSNLDVREGGSGCLLWFGELIDVKKLPQIENELDLFIRMSSSELEGENKSNTKKRMVIIVTSTLFSGMVLALATYIWKRKQFHRAIRRTRGKILKSKMHGEDPELPLFDFATLANATGNFAEHNKLGEGGYGPVYKGVLKDGQEIAVKRLSQNSRQGLNEFKNEVMHISRLQHRNLVKLLGCCIQKNEQMLIYELMPNKSLDFFIFDEENGRLLSWSMRYNIIHGIARGLLYLHQDSRLRIIHRDLKAENVLLDHEMHPKISDFGLARSFGGNEIEGNTNKVVGTLGYMSPEYVSKGLYSTKSDVFSFGVIVLEIISGKKNRRFCHPIHRFNLLGHAWLLYKEKRALELAPETVSDTCNISELLRSIQIGLLCVQSQVEDRPSMSTVVLMLSGEGALPQPKQPGFFADSDLSNEASSSSSTHHYSANEISITLFEGR